MQELLDKKDLVEKYLHSFQPILSAFSFNNLIAWSEFFQYSIVECDQYLCIFAKDSAGTFLWVPPLGKTWNKDIMQYCFDRMQEENQGGGITRIDYADLSFAKISKEHGFLIEEKPNEYCYARQKLVNLNGNLYKSQRHACNQFIKYYPNAEYQPYDVSMLEECRCLYNQWAQRRLKNNDSDEFRFMIEDSHAAHQALLKNYQVLNVIGRVVKVDNKIEAYTLGYPLNDGMFCVFGETVNAELSGISNYIFRALCSDLEICSYRWINVMDDGGFDSMMNVKNSYQPDQRIAAYIIKNKSE